MDKLQKTINKIMEQYPDARPCWDDWNKSWTDYKGEILVWFNVPMEGVEGMTTKAMREI